MNYYFKFKGLMWKYACVQATSLDKARRIVEKYRDDGIYIDSKKPIVTFEEYAQQKFERIELSQHNQMVWAVGEFADGTEYEIQVRKQAQKEDLINYFCVNSNGVLTKLNNPQIYEVCGRLSLSVKADKQLIEYLSIKTGMPVEIIQKQVKANKGPFPLFIYTIKEKVKEKLQLQ